MRTVSEHRTAALALVGPLPAVALPLDEAVGHVLAREVVSGDALPRWDNSAMDGYAVRADDVATATAGHPVTLRVLADLPAGSAAEPVVGPGTAARIMTGAPVPPGADAVVPVEQTDGGTGTVRIDAAPRPGAHIRRVGEDVRPGDLVLRAGTVLGPAQLAAAASVGCATLEVHRRPRVAVLSTGDELVPPGTDLRRGQVPDSNSFLLAAASARAGAEVERIGAVADDADALRAVLARVAGSADLVVTSGGVSMGAYDVVKEVLSAEAGMQFVQVAMQPGKPQGLGHLADGTPVLALPGNPVSAYVSFEVLVRPVLRRLRGLVDVDPVLTFARAAVAWSSPRGREQYMPVTLTWAPAQDAAGAGSDDRLDIEGGGLTVRPAAGGGSGSHLVASLAAAQGLAVVPADVERVEAGDRVRVMVLDR